MKKIYMFIALFLVSGLLFAQVKRNPGVKAPIAVKGANTLKAVKTSKKLNTLQAFSNAKAVIDSLNYDGDNYSGIGTGSADELGVYAFFPANTLTAHASANHYILSIKLYINNAADVTSSELRIYSDTGSTLLRSQAFTAVEGWNDVLLASPLAIPSTGDLYIGYNVIVSGGYPCGIDADTISNSVNWLNHGGKWQLMKDLDTTFTFNWNIRAMCGGLPTTPVAYCFPLSWNTVNTQISTSVTSGSFTLANAGIGTLTCTGITGLSAPFTTTLDPVSVNIAAGASTSFTFTYNPTIVASDNQTVVITTNAGDITIKLSGNGVDCSSPISSYPYTESFENTFLPACWTSNDADGDGFNWEAGSASEGISAHTGAKYAVSASYDNNSYAPLTPDNYLITPQFNINSENLRLSYWVKAELLDYPSENYSVLVSTTGIDTADFTEIFTEVLSDTTWTQRRIPLAAYNGQNIYIAFRHHNVTNMFRMDIDDVTIENITTPVATCNPLSWNVKNVPTNTTATSGSFTLTNIGVDTLKCTAINGLSAPFATDLIPDSVKLAAENSATFTFTYNPTAVVADSQTVVIATNAGDITIHLSGNGVDCSPISSYPYDEGFEGDFLPACWTSNDVDGDGFNWEEGFGSDGYTAHSGEKVAISASYEGSALTPDNYLITPQLNINAGNLDLTYWVAAQDPDYPAEKYSVMVSTTGTAPTDFTEVFTEVLSTDTWAQRAISLAAYNGQNIYIAFRHHDVTDMYKLKIDDIKIDVTSGISESSVNNIVSVYPNPATTSLNIMSGSEIRNVKIYNSFGQLVVSNDIKATNHKINIESFSEGLYMIYIETKEGVSVNKITIRK